MERLVYDVKDIQQLLKVKQTTAYRILKQAKQYQDNLNIAGRILVSDFIAWQNRIAAKDLAKK